MVAARIVAYLGDGKGADERLALEILVRFVTTSDKDTVYEIRNTGAYPVRLLRVKKG